MSKLTCKRCTFINEDDLLCCQACENVTITSGEFEKMCIFETPEPINISAVCPDWYPSERYEICASENITYESNPESDSLPSDYIQDSRHTDFDASNEIRIVLIGRTGSGKSATGNSLLGKEQFESMVSASSITSKCKRGESTQNGKKIIVVDTPGLFDTGMTNEKVTKEIVKCIGMTSPGPHAMVLVVGIGRFTKEEQDTVSHFVDHFGEGMLRYMIVLFTRKDDLTKRNQSICDYVRHVPQELASILQQCGNRYIAFNNDETGQSRKEQVAEFYDMVDRMVVNNGGSCYTSEIYQEAELTLQRRMRAQREKLEAEKRKEKEQIERQVKYKYEKRLEKEIFEKNRIEEELNSKKRQEEKDKEEKRLLEKEFEVLKQKLNDATNSGGRYDAEDKKRMEKQLESLQQQLVSSEIRSAAREREQLQRELDESNRRLQKELEAKDREMERELKREDDEYKSEMKTDKLRQKERDNVENENDGALSDITEGFKKLGSGFLKGGKKLLSWLRK